MSNEEPMDKLPLNVLLTRRCNASCAFCIEKTVADIQDKSTAEDYIKNINSILRITLRSLINWLRSIFL